ncbi:MAG: PhoH family protein [Pseudomonadota bacterium]
MKKIFILDTNILLSDPRSIFQFDDNDVVVPISVIEEIDTFKKDSSENGRNAREVSRILDRLRAKGTLSHGVQLFEDREDSGKLFVYLGQSMTILPELLADSTDNHILAIALTMQKQVGDPNKVRIVTKDSNLRIKADAFGIGAEDFEADKVSVDEFYTGVLRLSVPAALISEMYAKREVIIKGQAFAPNQFVVLSDDKDPAQTVLGIYNGDLERVVMLDIPRESVWGIYPRNLEQSCALAALLDDNIKLVTLSGGAGTGKTLMAIAAGLAKSTDEDVYQKLLVARPIFPLGKDLGFLPGDLDEKLNPWMQPIFDSLDFLLSGGAPSKQKRLNRSYQELITQGMLAVEPLTYIRGRSLPNQYFVVDESQNLTPHEIKTILTRAGEGTKIVLTGDPYQIDNPYIDSTNNGLTYVIERFKHTKIAAHVTLQHGERSDLATLAAELM